MRQARWRSVRQERETLSHISRFLRLRRYLSILRFSAAARGGPARPQDSKAPALPLIYGTENQNRQETEPSAWRTYPRCTCRAREPTVHLHMDLKLAPCLYLLAYPGTHVRADGVRYTSPNFSVWLLGGCWAQPRLVLA